MKKFTKNDYEILRMLVEEREFSPLKIAKAIGLSDKTVRNRIKLMEQNDVFTKVYAINPEFFGYNIRVDFFLNVEQENIDEVYSWLISNHKHNLMYLGKHWGSDNISLQAVFKKTNDAENFCEKLKTYKKIKSFKLAVVPIIFKEVYDWRPNEENFKISKKGQEELNNRRKNEKTTFSL